MEKLTELLFECALARQKVLTLKSRQSIQEWECKSLELRNLLKRYDGSIYQENVLTFDEDIKSFEKLRNENNHQ